MTFFHFLAVKTLHFCCFLACGKAQAVMSLDSYQLIIPPTHPYTPPTPDSSQMDLYPYISNSCVYSSSRSRARSGSRISIQILGTQNYFFMQYYVIGYGRFQIQIQSQNLDLDLCRLRSQLRLLVQQSVWLHVFVTSVRVLRLREGLQVYVYLHVVQISVRRSNRSRIQAQKSRFIQI